MTTAPIARPPLDRERLQALSGYDVRVLDEDPSTNATASRLAREGADAGTVVVTEHQTAGRGRLDRVWETPARSALTFSVVLRPDWPAADWTWLPLLGGVAVVRALARHGVRADLKWPNDVLLPGDGERKVAGLLAERVETPVGPAAVLGIGINISTTRDELPVPVATSLAITGAEVDRTELLIAILDALATGAAEVSAHGTGSLAEEYTNVCSTLERRVRVEQSGGQVVSGRALGVDAHGSLVLVGDQGRFTISAGDVIHLRRDDWPTGRHT